MMYRIHYTLADGSEDSMLISGGSIEGIQKRAAEEIDKRGAVNPWSEKVS